MTPSVRLIHVGEVFPSWCKVHGSQAPHRYQPDKTPPLMCVICESEKQPVVTNTHPGAHG